MVSQTKMLIYCGTICQVPTVFSIPYADKALLAFDLPRHLLQALPALIYIYIVGTATSVQFSVVSYNL